MKKGWEKIIMSKTKTNEREFLGKHLIRNNNRIITCS